MKIETIRGSIDSEQLGFCHSHEHLFIAKGAPSLVNPALQIDSFEQTVAELHLFRELGGKSIIDAQPIGAGRMEEWLYKASEITDIHVVASTGFHKMMFYHDDHWLFQYNVEQLADIFIQELQNGMYVDADVQEPVYQLSSKAGIIKTAIDSYMIGARNEHMFIAAAQAAVETGAPIMCHTESGEQALLLIDFYESYGIEPRQIIICHLDRDLEQIEYNKEVASRGVYLEYDTIGRYKYHSDEAEAEFIINMLEWGYADQILLGLDTTRYRLKSYGGEIGLDHLLVSFIPLLRKKGVSTEYIDMLFRKNPAIAFSNTNKGENADDTAKQC